MDLIQILLNKFEDPFTYLIIFLIYVILAAIILPIPVEIGLFNPHIHPFLLILILAVGKGIGGFIVFTISKKVRRKFKSSSIGSNWKITKKLLLKLEEFVGHYGHYGLFIIMSIPLMVDSITLYFFSLLNPNEKNSSLSSIKFVIINIAAGAIRGILILIIFYFVGIKLIQ
jgi:membrane protein YqaA with SNARE-associated domain